VVSLVLILGDQLSPGLSALAVADKARDLVVMAEVMDEATYVRHHPKKIAFCLSAMRKFSRRLEADGWRVAYTRLDDDANSHSIPSELLRRAGDEGTGDVIATEPGEWRLIGALSDLPLTVHRHPDTRFIASHGAFDRWAKGRKSLRMEYFYREMRRETGLLMDGDAPAGGKWNFDHENRKPAQGDLFREGPLRFAPDATVEDVLDLVQSRFPENFGTLRPFWFATDADQAEQALAHFLARALPSFGEYQDAMLSGDRFLYHAVISPYLNAGLLDPLDICRRAEAEYRAGRAPINAVEGFIRQILGWREFVRGLYFREGPDYPRRNALNHRRKLPAIYWGRRRR